jgi:rubrerythrin
MHKMTEQHLINAFGGESMAHMRYRHFSTEADREDFPNVSRLFLAIAHAEYIHAGDHFRELKHLADGYAANSMAVFGPGNTVKNLQLAIAGETFEIEEMYPTYIEVAKFQGEKAAQRSFEWSYATEKMHQRLFTKAIKQVRAGVDVPLDAIQVCEICGYTLEGAAPDLCPVCRAKKEKFTAFN